MDIFCETCNSKLRIPDTKIPENRALNILCPKCNGSIHIDKKTVSKGSQTNQDHESCHDVADKAHPEAAKEVPILEMTMKSMTDFLEDGDKTALVCDDSESNQNMLGAALRELGFKVSSGLSHKDVMEKLKFNHYNVIVINERFDGCPQSENPVLNHIQPMPIATRRNIFLALIVSQHKTFDNMAAFSKSANLVVNENDLSNVKAILKKSISDNYNFYKVFKETLYHFRRE